MEIRAYLRAQGAEKLYSHIAKGNTASIRTHEACGFYKISDMAAYVDGSVDGRACTYVCNL
jgi:L-amino acid N-acyltransferase YncA